MLVKNRNIGDYFEDNQLQIENLMKDYTNYILTIIRNFSITLSEEDIEEIKKQIVSLKRTFGFKFPIENPDNYLIYLVEEYKSNRKEEIDLEKKLKEKKVQ